jgi:tetratricopeptide (TPR) repeat protein
LRLNLRTAPARFRSYGSGFVFALIFSFAALAQAPAELERAIALEQNGQTDAASSLLTSLLSRNPRSPEAHNWLGVAYLQKNNLTDAEKEFREAVRLKPDFVRAYNNLGSTLAQAGDIPQGIQALEQGLKYAPQDLELRLNLGMALRSKGDAEGALALFKSLLKEHGDSPELRYQYAQSLRQGGDLAGAISAFETALDLNPEMQEAYYGLGQALKQSASRIKRSTTAPPELKPGAEALSRGDYTAARQAAEKAVAADTKSADAYNLLGYALWYGGDHAKAAEALDEALRLNPAAANVYSFRGLTYRESGDLAHARRALQRAIALDPQLPLPYYDLAVVFLREGNVERAVGQFEAGMNLTPAGTKVPDLDLAIRELRQGLSEKPEQAEAYNVLGRLLGLAGANASIVIDAFQQAIRLKPDNAEARNNIGLVYVQTGEDEKAVSAFREAVKLRPDYADAHQNLGTVLITSDSEEAVRELETAVKLQPRLLKAQYNLALAYEASPDAGPEKAIEQMRKVLAAEPRYPRAEFALGRFLLKESKVPEAVEHLQKAVTQNPESGEAHYQLGLALSRAGRAEEGKTEIAKSRELTTAKENREAAALDLAEARAALDQGDLPSAAAKARRVLSLQPDAAEAREILKRAQPAPSPSAATFEAYIRQGKFAEVEPLLREYLAQNPKSAFAWYALGYSLFAQRKIGESIKALSECLQIDVNHADAHKVLGRDLMIIGRFDAAKVEFQQGARLNPKSPEMPYNLGKLYSIQDNWADARKQFEAAVRLDPFYMEAYDALGFAMEALGDDAAATANYKKAIELNEARHAGFAAPYVNLSTLSNRTGDRQAAFDYARKALGINPKSDGALFQIAKAYEYEGQLQPAVDALEQAIAINARSSSYFYVLSGLYRKVGRTEDSKKALEAFTRLDRENNDLEQKRRDLAKQER